MSTTMSGQQAQQSGFGSVHVHASTGINEAKISIENLDFFYGDNRALKGIYLNLPDRQVTGMIGPSGCGKSTLLRVLNRMYDLYPGQRATGQAMLDGLEAADGMAELHPFRGVGNAHGQGPGRHERQTHERPGHACWPGGGRQDPADHHLGHESLANEFGAGLRCRQDSHGLGQESWISLIE